MIFANADTNLAPPAVTRPNVVRGFLTEDDLLEDLSTAGAPMKKATLRNLRAKREGPPWTKLGRTVLYPEVEFRAWLNSKMVKPARDQRRKSHV